MHVPKSDGSIRVCGDYKAINECIEDDVYKLPKVQNMFAMLSQSQCFQPIIFGLRVNLCFGVKTATSQFHRVMDSILSGIKGVMVRVDDILVATSGVVTTHVGVIKQVFSRLAKHYVKLNGAKC